MQYVYSTYGTCSRQIMVDIRDGIVHEVRFAGGCHGNLQGIGALAVGQQATALIDRLGGIRCGDKSTSCPDQLAQALRLALAEQAKQQAI